MRQQTLRRLRPLIDRGALLAAAVLVLGTSALGADPAAYPGSVDRGDGTWTWSFQPSGGANDGTDEGGAASGKDTTVLGDVNSYNNFGSAEHGYEFYSNCNGWTSWTLFRFDVAPLPPADDVVSVKLVLRNRFSRGYGWPWQSATTRMQIQAVNSPWGEKTATWASRPTLDPAVQATADLDTSRVLYDISPPSQNLAYFDGYVTLDVTSLYLAWKRGTRQNHGLAYLRTNAWCENANSPLVWTSDHPNAAWRPRLEFVYRGAPQDTTAPVFAGVPGAPGVVEQQGPAGSVVTLPAVTATDDRDGAVTVTNDAPGVFPRGDTVVTFTARDAAGNVATARWTVRVVDTTPPVLSGVPTGIVVVEQQSPTGASVTLPVVTALDAADGNLPVSCNAPAVFSPGDTTVTWTARDSAGNGAAAAAVVRVRDTVAPRIVSAAVSPSVLWPANHKMVPVTVSVIATDAATAAPVARIVSIASSEPDSGCARDDAAADWQITGALTALVRAERYGSGDGRTYSLVIACTDAAGNETRTTVTVYVPHDQRK